MRLRLSPAAEQDLESIGDHIAGDSRTRALSFVRSLRQQCRRIADHPLAFRQRPELGDRVRACVMGRYLICFEADAQAVTVLRVLHGTRDLIEVFNEGADGD